MNRLNNGTALRRCGRRHRGHAYSVAGIPKGRTFILGENGGAHGTVDLGEDYAMHLEQISDDPPAGQPFVW
ncbi:hypothetical protein ACFL6C_13530 [Myxococcota bacterium]